MSSVFSIDDDGMKKAWTTNDLITRAITSATTIRIGSSRQNDLGFLARFPDVASSSAAEPAASSCAAVPAIGEPFGSWPGSVAPDSPPGQPGPAASVRACSWALWSSFISFEPSAAGRPATR